MTFDMIEERHALIDCGKWSAKSIAIALLVAVAIALAGCVYRGAKVTEGTDLAVGFTVPGTEGAIQFDALNYLTGFRLGVAENAALTVEYGCAETNSYLWGAAETRVQKRVKAKVEPCEVENSQKTTE